MKERSYQAGLFGILSHLADLMILNLLYLISCIPLFTIGAANAALYDVTTRLSKDEAQLLVDEAYLDAHHYLSYCVDDADGTDEVEALDGLQALVNSDFQL